MAADFVRAAAILVAASLATDLVFQQRPRLPSDWIRLAVRGLFHGAIVLILIGSLEGWPAAAGFLISSPLLELLLQGKERKKGVVIRRWIGVGSLILVYALGLGASGVMQNSIWEIMLPGLYPALIIFNGFALSVFAASSLVGEAVAPYLDQIRAEKTHLDGKQLEEWRGLYGGGETIGKLERALIFLFVFVGQAAGVGFLIAAKSILRFGELNVSQDRMEAEYVILGTFYSFFAGLLAAYLTAYLLDLL